MWKTLKFVFFRTASKCECQSKYAKNANARDVSELRVEKRKKSISRTASELQVRVEKR